MIKGYIDFHVHPIERLISPKELLFEMKRSNVEIAVLLALDIDKSILQDKMNSKKFRKTLADSMVWDIESQYQLALNILEIGRTENETVKKFIDEAPNNFIGFGSVNPRLGKKYIKESINRIVQLGFKGIKIIPTLQMFDPSKERNLKHLWRLAYDNDLIILTHTGCDPGPWEYFGLCNVGHPEKLLKYISNFETIVVLAHAGAYSAENPGLWLESALSIANKYEHVWLDTSSVPYLFHNEKIVEMFREYNVLDKTLFGSDYPVVVGLDMARAVKLIEITPHLTDTEKIKILRNNALKLLRL